MAKEIIEVHMDYVADSYYINTREETGPDQYTYSQEYINLSPSDKATILAIANSYMTP